VLQISLKLALRDSESLGGNAQRECFRVIVIVHIANPRTALRRLMLSENCRRSIERSEGIRLPR